MEVWLVNFSDGGDYEGVSYVHKTYEGAEASAEQRKNEDAENGEAGYLLYFVSSPYQVVE